MLRYAIRIITALAASLVLSLWVIQNSATLQDAVGTKIVQFIEEDWSARIAMKKPRVNFFTFSIYLADGIVTPTDTKKYSWAFEEGRIHISPLALLTKRQAQLHITLNNVTASTHAHGDSMDIIEHIKQIIAPAAIEVPITLESLCITNIDATVDYGKNTFVCKAPGTLTFEHNNNLMRYQEPTWHGNLTLENAMLAVNNIPYAQQVTGETLFYLNEKEDSWYFKTKNKSRLPILDHTQDHLLEGSWNTLGGELMLTNQHQNARLAATFSYPLTIGLRGFFPANYVKNAGSIIASNTTNASPIEGICTVDTAIVAHNNILITSGTVAVDDLKIGNLQFQHVGCTLAPSTTTTGASTLTQKQSPGYGLTGNLNWDIPSSTGNLTLTNTQDIIVAGTTSNNTAYVITPKNGALALNFGTEGICKGSYRFTVNNNAYNSTIKHRGIMAYKNGKYAIKGYDNHGTYAIKAAVAPHVHLTSIDYEKNGTPLLKCRTSPASPLCLHGDVSWQFLKQFLDQQYRRMIFSNDGLFSVQLDQANPELLTAKVALAQGSFYMPEYHNVLKQFSASINLNPNARRLELHDAKITMSKGKITCPHAVAEFDDQYNLTYAMMPWKLENLFVNWKKDFYGFVYGTLTLNKKESEPPVLQGNLVLKRSQLKDSFLQDSTGIASGVPLSFPLGFDLKVVTEKPMRTKIGSFNALARIDLSIVSAPQKDLFGSPIVTGTIDLEKGAIRILNKTLALQYGKLQFLHNNLQDPLIDLMARSRIGKYLVSLQATGSVQKPTILLESTPSLSEEQIIGLLLTGSELSSLQSDLPAMLLQNLDALLFTTKKNNKQQAVLDTITKTFKYVQITPNLNAAAGERGMLKGSFTVNVTDQLRAKIDKDLDLQKNFSAQIEYLLSDNINLKLVQEQRGERGIEVEFRVKP